MSAAAVVPDSAPPAAKGGKKKLIVIGAVVLLVLLLAGAGAVWWLKHRAHAAELAAEAAAADEEGGKPQAAAKIDAAHPPIFLPLDPFVVNLADRDADRFVQIGITLELENAAFAEQIKGYMPAVRNAILMIIASKSSRDLLDRAGKEQLADEIMREAVRPMGIEIAAPKPITLMPVVASGHDVEAATGAKAASASAPASASAATPTIGSAASAAALGASAAAMAAVTASAPMTAPARVVGRPKAHGETQKNPIQHVHFSSFIIQ